MPRGLPCARAKFVEPNSSCRQVTKCVQIVTAPYPLLLQKTARDALGISFKDHVVIVDEAHNLMDAILGIYTIEVSLAQLQRGREQLTVYLQKYRNRLKGKNRVYVTQIVRLLDSLITYLQVGCSRDSGTSGTVRAVDLLAGKGVDQINLYKLMQYLQESKLARKVEGYALYVVEQDEKDKSDRTLEKARQTAVPVLTHIQSFFLALMNPASEGRFFWTKGAGAVGTSLKYLLLDPSEHFRAIVESARAVILAGGTMSPVRVFDGR